LEADHRVVAEIPLPRAGESTPGALCAVVCDEDGNFYWSDEFNHRVASLDRTGKLRWHLGGKGSQPGCFWYPRGFSLGCIVHEGRDHRCLAVGDSWNRRVQFIDLQGSPICSWGGGDRFGEVSDVRYLTCSGRPAGARGSWLVLDRGNHRLCVLDEAGGQLFTIGRALSPALESRWQTEDILPLDGSALPQSIFAHIGFDPLFYPARILGGSEAGLYIWEPFSQGLKQVLLGNLFRLPLDLPQGGEWISADCDGLVSWSRSSNLLCLHDMTGAAWRRILLEGTPVASDLPSNEVWLQSHGCLTRNRWERTPATGASGKRFALLQRSLEEMAVGLTCAPPSPVLQELSELLAAVESLSDNLATLSADEVRDPALAGKVEARMAELNGRLPALSLKLREFTRLSFAGSALVGAYALAAGGMPPQAELATRSAREVAVHMSAKLVDLQQRLDNLIMARTSWPEAPSGTADSLASCDLAVARQEDHLIWLIKELLPWAGISLTEEVSRQGDLPSRVETGPQSGHSEGCLLRLPLRGHAPRPSACLREIDRISLEVGDQSHPSRPYGLAATQDGHIFATLFGLNAVAHLDGGWRLLEVLGGEADGGTPLQGPVGIAADAQDRLWIAELAANRIRVWNPRVRSLESVQDRSRTPLSLRGPHGISRGHDGAMLIADTGNHRIIRIPAAGDWEAIGARAGTEQGEWRHPFGFCLDEASGRIWVVDHRNHRLQSLPDGGEPGAIIGGCGFGRGNLLWPESAALYADGLLAVAQGRFLRALKLFSGDGEELGRLALDFMPGCMLVSKGLLLVAEFDGNSIRIFERLL